MPDAVLVVELALGDRVVDVDRREQQVAGLRELVEPVDAGRRLLGDAPDSGGDARPLLRVVGEALAQQLLEHAELLGVLLDRRGHLAGRLPLDSPVDEHRGVAAVVEDHVGTLTPRPREDLFGAPPVLRQGLALPREDRDPLGVRRRPVGADDDGGSRLVLGREDVARGPTDLGSEGGERLDEDRRLDGHVQGPGDPGALERLALGVLRAQGHEPGHLVLREAQLVPPGRGEAQVGHLVVKGHGRSPWLGVLTRRAPLGLAGRHPRRSRRFYRQCAAAPRRRGIRCMTATTRAPTTRPRRADARVLATQARTPPSPATPRTVSSR